MKDEEEASFTRLYHEHRKFVFSVCLARTRDAQEAHELTQDAFVRAWEGRKSFRGDSHFRTWIYRIACNVAHNRHRAMRRHARRHAPLPPTMQPSAPHVDVLLQVTLTAALATLTDGQRATLIMHDLLGLTHDEIAHGRRVPTGTAKGTLATARRRLRALLAP